MPESEKLLLVGDNPFLGISHLSEDRARARGDQIGHAEYAAELILSSIKSGANGFMFSVSESTLSALKIVCEKNDNKSIGLHAIVPYAYEYVRMATHLGTLGLGKKLAKQVFLSGNFRTMVYGLVGVAGMDPVALMKTYISYEKSRIMPCLKKKQKLTAILLHEVITDMVLAMDLEKFTKSYVRFVSDLGIKPGFETRNFPYLVNKFKEWDIDFSQIELVSSFNKVGFQMNPTQANCEEALASIPECDVIAMSVLAAGYIRLPEAADYIKGLSNLKGLVVGVSKEKHAFETFSFLRDKFSVQRTL